MQAFNDTPVTEDLKSKTQTANVRAESQMPSDLPSELDTISDEQELFLKVLENLKNFVSAKPERHAIAHPKVAYKKQEESIVPLSLIDLQGQSKQTDFIIPESQSQVIRSDAEESSTITTVSDTTKSRILQKLAVGASNIAMDGENASNKEITVADKVFAPYQKEAPEKGFAEMKVSVVDVSNVSTNNAFAGPLPAEVVSQGRVIHKEVAGKVDKDKIVTIQGGLSNTMAQKNQHLLTLTPGKPLPLFSCKFCEYFSDNKSYLKQHIDLVHNSDRPYKCPYCDYAGKRSHALREHLIVHSNDRPYQCQSCNATFRKKGHLTNHVKLHNSKRLVKCPICKILVYDVGENGLDVHLKTDHDTERLYGCDLCDYVAPNEPGILKHLSEKHRLKNQSNKCERCPFETANNAVFEAHVAAHAMTDSTIQIGNNPPSKIVGVASLPSGTQKADLANACVKIGTKNLTGKPSPAVIKPVWIKCSECGFTAQDSEVIKKHMLDHLNMQDNEAVVNEKLQLFPSPHKSESSMKQNANTPTDCVSNSSVVLGSHSATKKGPILIPVSRVEKLLPQDGSKLDMQCPILVPVTNPEIVKNLQSFTHTSPKGSPHIVRLDNAMKLADTSQLFSVSGSDCATFVTTASSAVLTTETTSMNRVSSVHQSKSSIVSPGQNTASLSHGASATGSADPNKPQVIPIQREQMEALLKNPKFKMVPVDLTGPGGLLKGTGIQNRASSQSHVLSPSGSISVSAQNQGSSQTSHSAKSTMPLTVTEIPVPRLVNTNIPPKLPAELAQLSPSPCMQEEVVTTTCKTEAEQFEELTEEERLSSIKASLANIERLIEQQDKLSRRISSAPATLFSNTTSVANSAAGKTVYQATPDGKQDIGQSKVLFQVSPVEKQNTAKDLGSAGFTHDSFAGRFRCTLCGYKCEYQRTIKAHIWKHSGNKDLDYPMFQNGPLSIYDDGHEMKEEKVNVSNEIERKPNDLDNSPLKGFKVVARQTADMSEYGQPSGKMPSFIVYEQSKVSRMAPSLAKLIASRTEANTKQYNESVSNGLVDAIKIQKHMLNYNEHAEMVDASKESLVCKDTEGLNRLPNNMPDKGGLFATESKQNIIDRKLDNFSNTDRNMANVLVERVDSAKLMADFTGLHSQQNSPRILSAPKSPDSGITELTSSSQNIENQSMSSEPTSTGIIPNFEQISVTNDKSDAFSLVKRKMQLQVSEEQGDLEEAAPESPEGISKTKKVKVMQAHEDSAVTLLSLLKKGPNYNPACPPTTSSAFQNTTSQAVTSPSQDDSNSLGESDASGVKPKSGISTSLLAVIEQLRERSKPDFEEDKPVVQIQNKRPSKRRSRRSSLEEITPATGIGNVEEFDCEGLRKYRCRLCHYTNDSTLLLKQHMRLHKPKQEFECSLCDLITESNEALQDHMIQHCKVRTYQCKICNSTFNYKSQLRAHMRMHNDLDILVCDFCDFETRSAYALKVHTKTHLTKPPYKCQFCKEEFITSFNLRLHIREGCLTSVDKDGTFKCDECGFTCFTRRDIKAHTKLHIVSYSGTMGKVTVMKRCPYCEHSVATVEALQQHITEVHGESEPLKCDMCGFVAVSIRSLKSHMKRHVNDQRFVAQPLEQYKCNLCGYVCHHLPSLKSHMWRHAADEHYSYEFTNDVINAAIDFDGHSDAYDTTEDHVEHFQKLIYEKMKSKGLENTRGSQKESAVACCWVTFRCCQCGFETINKAELNMHMTSHSDVIKLTLGVPEEDKANGKQKKQASQIIHG